MNTKRMALQLTAVATALALGAAIPSVIGDARLPAWTGVAHWASRHVVYFSGLASQALSAAGAHVAAEFGFDGTNRAAAVREAAVRDEIAGPPTLTTTVGALGLDPTGLQAALAAYRTGLLADGDAAARRVPDALVRTALEWIAIRKFNRMR